MRLHRPSALLLGASLVLGAVATPSLAFADGTPTPTTISADDLVAALQQAEATSADAAKDGWSEQIQAADPDNTDAETLKVTYAVLEGRGYVEISGDMSLKEIDVQHQGSYVSKSVMSSAFGSPAQFQRVLNAVGKPHAAWIYVPDTTVDLTDPDAGLTGLSPDLALADYVDASETTVSSAPAPTETVAADGTRTYTFAANEYGDPELDTVTVTLNAAGAVTALQDDSSEENDSATFTYGAQHVALPSASEVVTLAQFEKGEALVTMASDVHKIAADTRAYVARLKPHTHTRAVYLVRHDVQVLAKKDNKADAQHVFTMHDVTDGARVTATNPFTHAKVSYTIKALGKRAVVHHG